MRTTLVQNARITFSDMQIKGSHLEFYLDIILLFFKSIIKNEFLVPIYFRIEVLVMFVAPQDQFYIETNLAYLLIDAICSKCSYKIAQSCRSSNKAKLAYLPTHNKVPSKNLYLTP